MNRTQQESRKRNNHHSYLLRVVNTVERLEYWVQYYGGVHVTRLWLIIIMRPNAHKQKRSADYNRKSSGTSDGGRGRGRGRGRSKSERDETRKLSNVGDSQATPTATAATAATAAVTAFRKRGVVAPGFSRCALLWIIFLAFVVPQVLNLLPFTWSYHCNTKQCDTDTHTTQKHSSPPPLLSWFSFPSPKSKTPATFILGRRRRQWRCRRR